MMGKVVQRTGLTRRPECYRDCAGRDNSAISYEGTCQTKTEIVEFVHVINFVQYCDHLGFCPLIELELNLKFVQWKIMGTQAGESV